MTPLQAQDALFGIVKSAWTTQGKSETSIKWPDISGQKSAGAEAWCRVTLQHVNGGLSSLSNHTGWRRFTADGFITVQVFAPIGDGSMAVTTLATALKQGFEDAHIAGLRLTKSRMNEIPGGDGVYSQINVIANFEYETTR